MKHKDDETCINPECPFHGDLENMTEEQKKITGITRAILSLAAIRELDPNDLCEASTNAILTLCAIYLERDAVRNKDVQKLMKDEKLFVFKNACETPPGKNGLYFKLCLTLEIVQGVPSGESLQ